MRASAPYCYSLILFASFLLGCAHGTPSVYHTHEAPSIPHELEERILALDPEKIVNADIERVLSRAPAPRIISLDGSIPFISMKSFSKFLIAMGYPEDRVRNPRNGNYSYSSYQNSTELAGMIAWYYEREGMMPIVIGHSQGGVAVVKVLHELSGTFHKNIPVWNPYTESPEERFTIIDPLNRNETPVVGLRLGFASAVTSGRLMRFVLGQWDMISRLREIPDSVEEFSGYAIPHDLLGDSLMGTSATEYRPIKSSVVRNIMLPADYSHFTIPLTEALAHNAAAREWINTYMPLKELSSASVPEAAQGDNVLFAADIWYSIKKHWTRELQRLILSKRNPDREP